ncbi:MAG: hypothetical protein JJ855_04375 [Rhodospirillales bacterium]|nr:hypothetical protein [Rhodospirillales bacterium]
MSAVIITTCTNRKQKAAPRVLQARNLKKGSVEDVAKEWVRRLSGANERSFAAQVYCGRTFVEASLASEVIGAPLYVISAGLGLVGPDDEIPAYDLTTAKSSKDRIQIKIIDPIVDADWWSHLGAAKGDEHPLASLLKAEKNKLAIIGLSSSYLDLVRDDLCSLSMPQINRLRLVGIRPSVDVPEKLASVVMPYDDRLDGPDTPNPGTRGDFAQRALHHFCQLISEKDKQRLDQRAHAQMVRTSLKGKRSPEQISRKAISDDDLIQLVPDLWDRAEGKSSKMLRILRDEEQIACEQGRFATLFKRAKEAHGLA